MKLHPRYFVVEKAKLNLDKKVIDWAGEHDLTDIEVMKVVNEVLHEALARYFKYELRFERHGNYEDEGDLA